MKKNRAASQENEDAVELHAAFSHQLIQVYAAAVSRLKRISNNVLPNSRAVMPVDVFRYMLKNATREIIEQKPLRDQNKTQIKDRKHLGNTCFFSNFNFALGRSSRPLSHAC